MCFKTYLIYGGISLYITEVTNLVYWKLDKDESRKAAIVIPEYPDKA